MIAAIFTDCGVDNCRVVRVAVGMQTNGDGRVQYYHGDDDDDDDDDEDDEEESTADSEDGLYSFLCEITFTF